MRIKYWMFGVTLLALASCSSGGSKPESIVVSFESPRWAKADMPKPDAVKQFFVIDGKNFLAEKIGVRNTPLPNTSWYRVTLRLSVGHHLVLPVAGVPNNPSQFVSYASQEDSYSPVAIDRGDVQTQLCFDLENLHYGLSVEHEVDDGPAQVVGDALKCALPK